MHEFTWLLDVDGVLNANKSGWSAAPHSGTAYYLGTSWKMRWAPQLMERVRKVHSLPYVEVLWATSWCGYTDQLEKLFKLPALRSAWSTRMYNDDKVAAAEKVLASGNKLIWTDDEAIPYAWKSNSRQLLIAPKPNRGLRPEHLDQIDEFLSR